MDLPLVPVGWFGLSVVVFVIICKFQEYNITIHHPCTPRGDHSRGLVTTRDHTMDPLQPLPPLFSAPPLVTTGLFSLSVNLVWVGRFVLDSTYE